MARVFRLWEKKRGERRTGSPRLGSLGEAFFFGVMFLLGAVLVTELVGSELRNPRPEQYTPGFGFWLNVLVRASLLVIGGGGVIYTVLQVGASAERRSAIARRAANLDLVGDGSAPPKDFPTVPGDANLTNSPGVLLAYRLPTSQTPAWSLFAATTFCLLWSAAAAAMSVVAINDVLSGDFNWFILAVAAAFVAVGAGALYYFFRQLAVHSAIGPLQVEISAHPFRPGGCYDVFLSQSGHFAVKWIELSLVCEERSTFTQGTDIRTETRVTHRQRVFRREDFKIDPAAPLQQRLTLQIPENIMHSFGSRHNGIDWLLEVRGEAESWPAYERRFPVVVYPPGAALPAEENGRSAAAPQPPDGSPPASAAPDAPTSAAADHVGDESA